MGREVRRGEKSKAKENTTGDGEGSKRRDSKAHGREGREERRTRRLEAR